jgi:hypothetical protein
MSTARLGNLSFLPSENRRSHTKFCPSTHPLSRRPSDNTFATGPVNGAFPRYPTRYISPDCCARMATGATSVPASEVSRKRRRSMGDGVADGSHSRNISAGTAKDSSDGFEQFAHANWLALEAVEAGGHDLLPLLGHD